MFRDRSEAGRQLAEKLAAYANREGVVVLALPRGGVPVAYEVARALSAPLDVFVVRKLGVPGQEELAMGAIATGDVQVLNRDVLDYLHIPPSIVNEVAGREREELKRRELAYRGGRPALEVRGMTVVLIDDGLATGSTMLAAVAALKQQLPSHIVIAVPVAPRSTYQDLMAQADEVIALITPEPFHSVSRWYHNFEQATDEEVRQLLEQAAGNHARRRAHNPQ